MKSSIPKQLDLLSPNLRIIVEYELGKGNKIIRIDQPAGTKCPLAIIFDKKLDFSGHEKVHGEIESIVKWENHDTHYDLEAGYQCEKTRHALAGPL